MDFFEHQNQARRNTRRMVVYLVLAISLIILAVNVCFYIAFAWGQHTLISTDNHYINFVEWCLSAAGVWVTLVTLALILGGSLWRLYQLAEGGPALAEMLGATAVDMSSRDPDLLRLINLTEEMSLASGTPMPRLYVLEHEPNINAFVAGTSLDDIAMVVTQGALQNFSRDELQGVIGHEYSHILNGDIRINLRLIGLLAGILTISEIGRFLFRSTRHTNHRTDRKGGQIELALALLGLALMAIGYIGLFFGRLIQAAISRQREFLADASAVQFTRDNHGIASALARIRMHTEQGVLHNQHAEEVRHLCFESPTQIRAFSGWLASHPPLDARIQALGFTPAALQHKLQRSKNTPTSSPAPSPAPPIFEPDAALLASFSASSSTNMARPHTIGTVHVQHMEKARELHQQLPEPLLLAARSQVQAAPLLLALVSSEDHKTPLQHSVTLLQNAYGPTFAEQFSLFAPPCRDLDAEQKFALLRCLQQQLHHGTITAKTKLLSTLDALLSQDQHITPFEFVTHALVHSWLGLTGKSTEIHQFSAVEAELACAMAAVVNMSGNPLVIQQQRFHEALQPYQIKATFEPGFDAIGLEQALARLKCLNPTLKRPVVQSLVDLIVADRQITTLESALLMAICAQLGCPMPPLTLPGLSAKI